MLVTFSSKNENITMFGEVAIRLLKMMGHSGTVPSAIQASDVPEALEKLKKAIQHSKEKPPAIIAHSSSEDDHVSIAHRALPLIGLLENAVTEKCNVMWK